MSDGNNVRELWNNWQPPPELQRSRPRPVRFTGKGKATMVIAVVLVAGGIAMGAFLYGQVREERRRDRLLGEAASAGEAQITRLWQRSGKSRSCYASYQFASGGAELSATATVPCRAWAGLSVGQNVLVRYVASDPRISRLEGIQRAGQTPLWVVPLAFIAMAGSALLIFLKLTRERRLLEEGQAAPGIVTKLGMRTDKGRMVYYQFATYSGSAVKGKYGPVHGKWVLSVGTPIVVLYDRDEPKRNTRYPSSLVTLDD